MEEPADSERASSPSLRREAVERALRLAKGLDFDSVVDARGVRAAGLSLAVIAALALALTLSHPPLAWTAFFRLAHPFGGHEWPRQTRLEVNAPSRVAQGEAFEIHSRLQGFIPERARVEFRFHHAPPLEQDYEIGRENGGAEGVLTARLEAGRVQRDFRFQVRANDAVSVWQAVTVLPPPQLVPLAGRPSPQVWLRFPEYTGLPAVELPDGTSSIEAAAGTHVRLRAAVDRPLVRAWLEYPSELERPLTLVAFLNALGIIHPSVLFELGAAYQKHWRRIPARLEAGGTVLTLDFIARVSGTFALHFEDEMGLRNLRFVELRTLADPAPLVHLERPSRSRDSLEVLPDADITLQVQTEDPRYAVRSVFLNYRHISNREGEAPAAAGRLPLYDHAAMGDALSQLLAALTTFRLVPPLANLQLRPPRLAIERRWSLGQLKLKEGNTLVLQACADDFDDVTVGKKAGCSQEVELHVVSRTALDLALNEAQALIQQELIRLHNQQQEALAKVIRAETHWRNQQGALLPQHLDELMQAEQLQQQIQARVGGREEGLRAEVARILQTLQDNHLPRSGTQDRTETVAAELERLAREELGPVESQLTEARKQNETRIGQQPTTQADTNPLAQARQHQEEVQKTLRELLKLLEPWSSTQEIKGEAKSILQAQRKLAEQTADLARALPLMPKRTDLKPAQRAELEQAGESQRGVAERADQLLQKMKRLAADRVDQDPGLAKQLSEAASRAEETAVSGKMRAAEQSLRNMQLANAGKQQVDSAKAMEDVVAALEDRRQDDLDRLIKKMKEAEEKLAGLAEQQDRLRTKAKEAGDIADAIKRADALKRLAREQEQLQRMTQEMVRELSRLRAEAASQALAQASGGMQRAGRHMQEGDSPEEQHNHVLDRLNEAQQNLQEAREETEQELAREKLAKLADQIKGLRERQESISADSARIHEKVLQAKQWERTLRASLRGLMDAQHALADETERLAKEKLNGTKVFAHLLDKSAHAMQQASERMLERLDQAQERVDNATADSDSNLDVAAEQTAEEDTRRWQRAALERIDRLLDALKPDDDRVARSPSEKGRGGRPGGGRGGAAPAGGERVPPRAQLKALRALQQEVNERTRAFDHQHSKSGILTEKDEGVLQALRQEQADIAELFQQLTAPPDTQGDQK
jgi:hypothetical protein